MVGRTVGAITPSRLSIPGCRSTNVCLALFFHSQFMDSMQLDPETVDNLDAYSHIPPQLMEKCAALSVRPDTVKNLVQSMQGE